MVISNKEKKFNAVISVISVLFIFTNIILLAYVSNNMKDNVNICEKTECIVKITNGTCTMSLVDSNDVCKCFGSKTNGITEGIIVEDCYMIKGITEMCPISGIDICNQEINNGTASVMVLYVMVNLVLIMTIMIHIVVSKEFTGISG